MTLVFLLLSLSACQTMYGIGTDIKSVGQGIEDLAR